MPLPHAQPGKTQKVTVAIGQKTWTYRDHLVRLERADDTIEITDPGTNEVVATAPRAAVMIEW